MQAKNNFDEDVIKNLQTFGQMLETEAGADLRADQPLAGSSATVDASNRIRKMRRRQRLSLWAAAAALLTVILGVTVLLVKPSDELQLAGEIEKDLEIKTDNEQSQIFDMHGSPIPTGFAPEQNLGTANSVFLEEHNDFYMDAVIREIKTKELLDGKQHDIDGLLNSGDLKVYTNYDPQMQLAAVDTVYEKLPIEIRNGSSAGVITVDSKTGAVHALVGAAIRKDYYNEGEESGSFQQIEVMTEGLIPGAGTYIPVTLAALFEAGYIPNDTVSGETPCAFMQENGQVYSVMGGTDSASLPVTLKEAANKGYNCSQVRLGSVVGSENIVEVEARLGISHPLGQSEGYLSTPLGVTEVTPIDVTAAYATFANDGQKVDPWFVSRIETGEGDLLFEREETEARQVVTPQTARLVTDVLEATVMEGTGKKAQLENHPMAGQTGTANGRTDAWFVGYTDYYVTAVWLGNNADGSPETIQIDGYPEMSGGILPAEIFAEYMNEIHRDAEPVAFNDPELVPGKHEFLEALNEVEARE